MKKIMTMLCLLVLVFTVAGCKKNQGPADYLSSLKALGITADNLPRIDGSTANIPLGLLLMQGLLDITQDEAERQMNFSGTSQAYRNLHWDYADLVIAYEPSDNMRAEWDDEEWNFDYYPIGLDALVFIVNEANPINSLTQQQLIDIYSGKTTNWSAVGGSDREIAAFQRNASSGSQSLMNKLLMKEVPMDPNAPTEYIVGEMGMLLEALVEYNNEANAIGYSVFYYANYMYAQPGLKMLQVDGVTPSNATIQSGEYPLVNAFYAVVRKSEPADSPARKLAEWLGTAEGKALLLAAGYVPTPK